MKKNIFVVGMDSFNLEKLEKVPAAEGCVFHSAIDIDEIRNVDKFDVEKLLSVAENRMRAVEGGPAGVITYFDFPAQDMVPILASRMGLPGPSFESVLKCEHKYWSRLEQQKVISKHIPAFYAFDPFDEDIFDSINMPFPFWIKPFRSFRSFLAFEIENRGQFEATLEEIRESIDFIHKPFMQLLQNQNLSADITQMKESCIAETPLYGRQCTLEGYVYNGKVKVYGVVDSVRDKHFSSFSRYEYPSSLPKWVQKKMMKVCKRFIRSIGFDNSAFNVEFFYDPFHKQVYLLEINTRISQSHADLFEKVHGVSHHQIMLQLALGEKPKPLGNKGKFRYAAKFMLRTFDSGKVVAVPSDEEIASVMNKMPGTIVKVLVKEGQQLAKMELQDSYSYELADIFIGANKRSELVDKYDRVIEMITFSIKKDF
jgi:hypothetical protein